MARNRDSSERDLREKAFELGYFIHRDRSLAKQILIEAEDHLEVAAVNQKKRRFYELLGRRRDRARRDKVNLERAPLLQYLVYVESELRELEQERSGGTRLTDEDRIVRYIKHLVRITLSRNAFYVCIGIGRLLYRYSTSELLRLYDVLAQDADHCQSSDYFRSRKKILIDEILRRFSSTVRLRSYARGEKNFESRPPSEGLIRLVEEALCLFTPWKTACPIPKDFDPHREVIPELRFEGSDPDGEHAFEQRRMHAVLHPLCLAQLVSASGFEAPGAHLAVPIFFADSNSNGADDLDPGDGRRGTSPLSDEEFQQIEEELKRRNDRRDRWKLRLLSVRIGNEEIGTIDLLEVDRAHFHLPAGTNMVEVWGELVDGSVRLATYLPGWRGARYKAGSEEKSYAVVELRQGQEIRFVVPPTFSRSESTGDNDSAAPTMLEIRYRETRPLRALSLFWLRLWHSSRSSEAPKRRRATVFASVCTFIFSAALMLLFALPERWGPWPPHNPNPARFKSEITLPGPPPESVRVSLEPVNVPSELQMTPSESRGAISQSEGAPFESPEMWPHPTSTMVPLRDPVRGVWGRAGVSISEAEILYIEITESDDRLRALKEGLVVHLGGDDRFRLTEERVTAEAVLRLSYGDDSFSPSDGSLAHIPLLLVNRRGEILWRENLGDPAEDETVRAQRAAESLIISSRPSH